MQLEKIITREDGTKVNISVSLSMNHWENIPTWSTRVTYCPKGKRTWNDTVNTDDYSFRVLDGEGRKKYIAEKQAQYVTESEILEVKTALWESIKPV